MLGIEIILAAVVYPFTHTRALVKEVRIFRHGECSVEVNLPHKSLECREETEGSSIYHHLCYIAICHCKDLMHGYHK